MVGVSDILLDRIIELTALWLFMISAIGILVKAALSLVKTGATCRSVFSIMWALAYGGPTAVYLASPSNLSLPEAYSWIDGERWAITALFSLAGVLLFNIGYALSKIRVRIKSSPKLMRTDQAGRETPLELAVWGLCILAQVLLVTIVLLRGIRINFAHRAIHWQQVGLAIRLAYLCLPTLAIGSRMLLRRKSTRNLTVFLVSLSLSVASAVIVGARMFLILLPVVGFLIYTSTRSNRLVYRERQSISLAAESAAPCSICVPAAGTHGGNVADVPTRRHRPKSNVVSLRFASLLTVALFAFSVAYYAVLRDGAPRDARTAAFRVFMGDIGRIHTLAYTLENAGLASSELVGPPLVSSYLYWLVLPIPRATWASKPYPANIQFSFHFRSEHTSFYVPPAISEAVGRTEFGFIEEAVLNMGFLGILLLVLLGVVAGILDASATSSGYIRVSLIMFCMLGTIYSFNGVLNYLAPLLAVSCILDLLPARSRA